VNRFLRSIAFAAACVGAFALVVLAAATTERREYEITNEERIAAEIDFTVGDIQIKRCSDNMAAIVEGEYDDRRFDFDLDYELTSTTGNLFFETADKRGKYRADDDNFWLIELTDKLPIELTADIGAADCEMDLGGLLISRLDIDIGASDCFIAFYEPNLTVLESIRIDAGAASVTIDGLGNANFREFEFDGGVGSYDIDFSGEFDFDAQAEISVGLGSVDIRVPDHIAVRVHADDGFLSSIDLPRRHFEETERGLYRTANWDSASSHLDLILDVGLGSIDVDVVR
jgi:hypothetical protein